MIGKYKKYLSQSAKYGLAGVLSRFSTLITVPIYTRLMGIEAFGVLDFYIALSAIFFVFVELQISSGYMREYYERKEKNETGALLGNVFVLYVFSFLFFVGLYFVLSNVSLLPDNVHVSALTPVIFALFPKLLVHICGIHLRLESKANEYLTLSVIHFFLIALFGVSTALFFDGGVVDILYSLLGAQVVSALLYAVVIGIKTPAFSDLSFSRSLMMYGLPLVPAVAGGWLMEGAGRMAIADHLTEQDLGNYSLLLKVGMVMMLCTQIFRMVWEPVLMRALNETDEKLQQISKALPIYFLAAFTVGVMLVLASPLLLQLLGGTLNTEALLVLALILLSYLWLGGISIVGAGILFTRKTYLNSVSSLTGGVVSSMFAFSFVGKVGIVGASFAFLLGAMTNFIVSYYFSQRVKPLPFSNRAILISAMLTVFVMYISIVPHLKV